MGIINSINFDDDSYSMWDETILLGMILRNDSSIPDILASTNRDFFYYDEHKILFDLLESYYNKNNKIDEARIIIGIPDHPMVRGNRSIRGKVIDAYGRCTESYLRGGEEAYKIYVENIRRLYYFRELKKLLIKSSGEHPAYLDSLMENLQDKIGKMQIDNFNQGYNINDIMGDTMKFIQKHWENKDGLMGYSTGWGNLDKILDGLQPGKLVILGARPSVGKTALSMQMAVNLAKQKIQTSVFSLEMSRMSLMVRMIAYISKISIYNILHKNMNGDDAERFSNGADELSSLPLRLYDNCINEKELTSYIRNDVRKYGTKVFFLDHLGLLRYSDQQLKRVQQLDEITQSLLHLAQTLDITIVVLCQLKRDAEGKQPTLADLRESGAIEQNADICMFLHRDRAQGDEDSIPAQLQVIKHRDGACGVAYMDFFPKLTYFNESSREDPVEEETVQSKSYANKSYAKSHQQEYDTKGYEAIAKDGTRGWR